MRFSRSSVTIVVLAMLAVAILASECAAHQTTIYYFHSAYRCETCLLIEGATAAALSRAFSQDMAAGEIEWRPVDIDIPGNFTIAEKHGAGRNDILILYQDGEKEDARVLTALWNLAENPESLGNMVVAQIAKMREQSSRPAERQPRSDMIKAGDTFDAKRQQH